jgi:hypothetical protein
LREIKQLSDVHRATTAAHFRVRGGSLQLDFLRCEQAKFIALLLKLCGLFARTFDANQSGLVTV